MHTIKILSIQYPERYVVRRLVTLVYQELLTSHPDLKFEINEVSDATEIGKYSSVIILPTLVVDEKVVSSGRFPSKEEIGTWLKKVIQDSDLCG